MVITRESCATGPQPDVRPLEFAQQRHLDGVMRRLGHVLYYGALLSVTAWGASASWSFTTVVAREVIAARHPDILARDPMLEAMFRNRHQRVGVRTHHQAAISRRVSRRGR